MTAAPNSRDFTPQTKEIWQLVQRLQTHFSGKISPQGNGGLHPNGSANVLETLRGEALELKCKQSLKDFIDTLCKRAPVRQTNAKPRGKVDFELDLEGFIITGEGDLGQFELQIRNKEALDHYVGSGGI